MTQIGNKLRILHRRQRKSANWDGITGILQESGNDYENATVDTVRGLIRNMEDLIAEVEETIESLRAIIKAEG